MTTLYQPDVCSDLNVFENSFTSYFLSSMEIPVRFFRVGTNIFWNCTLRHGMWCTGVYVSLTWKKWSCCHFCTTWMLVQDLQLHHKVFYHFPGGLSVALLEEASSPSILEQLWKQMFLCTWFHYMASSLIGQGESNLALWLATRAGKVELSCPLGTTRHVPQKNFPQSHIIKSFMDQACSVKVAGYWPRSCFWEFMDLDPVLIHKYSKKELGQYPAILTADLVNNRYVL